MQRGRLSLKPREWARAKETATELVNLAAEQLGKVSQELGLEIGNLGEGFRFGVSGRRAPPNLAEFYRPVTLSLNTGRNEALTISFRGVGPSFRGLISVVGHLAIQGTEDLPIEGATFQINYEEDLETAKARFSPWLDGVIVRGLNEWRRSL